MGIVPGHRGIMRNRSNTKFAEITDGSSNTILFGETNPIDTEYAWIAGGVNDSFFEIGGGVSWGSDHPGDVFNLCFADGSVHILTESVDPSVLTNLSSMEDGQVIGDF